MGTCRYACTVQLLIKRIEESVPEVAVSELTTSGEMVKDEIESY